ncbi:MAG TPA: methyltransferase domain-containing protein [Roseiarcus sp.]|nr:methyltransferase domain-containing protein [Roseiarcus sp.]
MNEASRQAHWRQVYTSKGENEVSWFQENPAPSLDLIARTGAGAFDSRLIDIGGVASRLVDAPLDKGFRDITALDLSEAALAAAEARRGERAGVVRWLVADATIWRPQPAAYDVWRDRAAFHFLIDEGDRAAYIARLTEVVKPGGCDHRHFCAGRTGEMQRPARRALRRAKPRLRVRRGAARH